MTEAKRAENTVLGALVADAATMGFHWLYSQDRIAALGGAAPEFRAPNPGDYLDEAGEALGYFAHGGKTPGQPSQYGAQMLTMSEATAAAGRYEPEAYAAAFRAAFGYGGSWIGYIDRPTRATLDAMAAAEAAGTPLSECGADDEQLPALSKLPPLVARHYGDPELQSMAESAVRVTNDRDDSAEWGRAAALMIKAAIEGASPAAAAEAGRGVSTFIADQVDAALAMRDKTPEEVASAFALHCHLDVAFPVMVHLIATAKNYPDAIRANIRAGGDNCGRSILVGAVLGACFAGDGEKGVPADWLRRVETPGAVLAAL